MNKYIAFLALLICTNLNAQKFEASLVLGFNAAQIDGDNLAGYKKIGLTGGAKVSYNLNTKWKPSIEFLYSQRGSRNNVIPVGALDAHIDLKYIEIPFLFAFQDWYIAENNYYKVRAEGGLSYGRVVSKFSSIDALGPIGVENIKDNDISLLLGVGYQFTSRLGLGVRYTRSLLRLYQNNTTGNNGLLSYFLTCRAEYQL